PKPEAKKPEAVKPAEAAKPAETKKEAVKPETVVKPKTAKPETKPAERPAQKPAVEVQRSVVEERGLRRDAEKPAVKPEPEAAGPAGRKPPAVTAVEEAGRGLRREVEKPTVKPEAVKPTAEARPEVAKPETAKPEAVKPAERPAVEAVEERGLRREVVKPEVVKSAEVKRPEAVKPEVVKPAAEAPKPAVEGSRGLRQLGEKQAPIANVIPERVAEAVDYLIERFGLALDRNAAFKAKSLVTAKVQTHLEKVAVKEPEFAHILAEAAEHVLSSFGRLLASPNAARHVHEALFYYFEGYQTRDGEVLYARIERTVREAVRKAEEAGIPDAEYRIKQFILEIIDILATAGERYRKDALKAVSTVEKTLRTTALAGLSTAALYSVYHGLYSEAVLSSVATAVAFAEVGQFKEAVQYIQKAAKTLYDTAKDVFEHVKVTVQRLAELFVEAVTRMLAWIDEHKAHLFLTAAVTAGATTLTTALNLWGLVELEKLAYAATLTPFVFANVDEYSREKVLNILRSASNPYETFKEIVWNANVGNVKLAEPWESLRMLITPKKSEKRRFMFGKAAERFSKYSSDHYKRALFYATLALEEAFSVYRSALREVSDELKKVVSIKKDVIVVDFEKIKQLNKKEEEAYKNALSVLRDRLDEYAKNHRLKRLFSISEDTAKELAKARFKEFPKFNDVNFGTKAYAALVAYREYVLGRKGAFSIVARYWLEEGGSVWLYYRKPVNA
ncbi:MAG: hypothetical protein ACO2PN_03690, partial [Pyrobaculum sp.]